MFKRLLFVILKILSIILFPPSVIVAVIFGIISIFIYILIDGWYEKRGIIFDYDHFIVTPIIWAIELPELIKF